MLQSFALETTHNHNVKLEYSIEITGFFHLLQDAFTRKYIPLPLILGHKKIHTFTFDLGVTRKYITLPLILGSQENT